MKIFINCKSAGITDITVGITSAQTLKKTRVSITTINTIKTRIRFNPYRVVNTLLLGYDKADNIRIT
jgi:hypothetical protein